MGSVGSGTVAVGQQITGAEVVPETAIQANLGGSGAGSTWVVSSAQTVPIENITAKAPRLVVSYDHVIGKARQIRNRSGLSNGERMTSSVRQYVTREGEEERPILWASPKRGGHITQRRGRL